MRLPLPVLTLLLTACGGSDDETPGYSALVQHVEANRVGADQDQWIEMRNLAGQWEKTALVFGYRGDFEECEKAIAGLKEANAERQYRCVPAN